MSFRNVLSVVFVDDLANVEKWYEAVFGRPADRRPMDGCIEWQLAESGGVQVYAGEPDLVGGHTVIVSVEDVDAEAERLGAAGMTCNPPTFPPAGSASRCFPTPAATPSP